jgi:hypothetical protein
MLPYAYTAESDALDGGVVLPDFHYEILAVERH